MTNETEHPATAPTHNDTKTSASEPSPPSPTVAPPDRAMGPAGTGWHIDVIA